jgi:hypothetical protein
MNLKVIGTAISTANALYPTIASQKLRIPAIGCIVSHLIGHMLTKAQLVQVNANLLEK